MNRDLFFILVSILLIGMFFLGCNNKQPEKLPDDKIIYSKVDQIIIGVKKDTIYFTPLCGALIFEIFRNGNFNSADTLSMKLNAHSENDVNCFHAFCVNSSSFDLTCLTENIYIPYSSFLGNPDNEYSIDDYNGKGEKYIGVSFIQESQINYAWIKIYCSLHNDTLKIIDWAYNQTVNGRIKTGQKN
jgi:hypothetical protein